jgi:hypothetical protein
MDVRQQPQPRQEAPAPSVAARETTRAEKMPNNNKLLFSLLTLLAILGILGLLLKGFKTVSADSAINKKAYQALFLTNGQVYFGHLSQVQDNYVKLKDIYYLQVQQTVQPKDSSAANAAANQSVSLAKLGNELHGPEDVMYVSHDQVLFWENLKDSGKVAQAIKSYLATQKK